MTTNETRLSPGLLLRPARWSDLETVAKLILDVCAADGDATLAVTPEELARHPESHTGRFLRQLLP